MLHIQKKRVRKKRVNEVGKKETKREYIRYLTASTNGITSALRGLGAVFWQGLGMIISLLSPLPSSIPSPSPIPFLPPLLPPLLPLTTASNIHLGLGLLMRRFSLQGILTWVLLLSGVLNSCIGYAWKPWVSFQFLSIVEIPLSLLLSSHSYLIGW